jgi:ribosome-binding protein aMBF1 (putative translation factor)
MTANKQPKCSICGRAIKTAFGRMMQQTSTLVCRQCFGEQSYAGARSNNYSVASPGETAVEGIG